MTLAPFPATADALETQWPLLGEPGDWWTGPERVAIVAEARAARDCSLCAVRRGALSPYAVEGAHAPGAGLPALAVDAVHRVSTDPGRLSRRWFEECQAGGLAPAQIVELGGIVATVQIADTLARALGAHPRPLPVARPGEPSRTLPPGLADAGGWAPMVDPGKAEGPIRAMFENVAQRAGFVFNVVRALSASPSAWSGFLGTFLPNYATDGPMPEGGLERVQVELLASATSSHNDCFY